LYSFFITKWSKSNTAWHKTDVHPALLKYFSLILEKFPEKQIRVLVPLCGKTKDLTFLANHPAVAEVVGVEGVQKAYDEFIAENRHLNISLSQDENSSYPHFTKFVGNKITLLKGDFFDLEKTFENESVPKFDLIWDRASIVAIRPELRNQYAQVISKLLQPKALMLFGTVDRREGTEDAMKAGPPFSVTYENLNTLYESLDIVESCKKLEEHDEIKEDPEGHARYVEMGLTSFFEVVTLIETK